MVHRGMHLDVQTAYSHCPKKKKEWWFNWSRVGLSPICDVDVGLDDLQSSLPKKISMVGYIRILLCHPMLAGDMVS